MIQYATPTLSLLDSPSKEVYNSEFVDKVEALKSFKSELQGILDQIHSEFGGQSLIYIEDGLTLEKRLALWNISDI